MIAFGFTRAIGYGGVVSEESLVPDPQPGPIFADPICTDGLMLADAAFACFIPGEVNDNNLPSCLGAWYDACSGSE